MHQVSACHRIRKTRLGIVACLLVVLTLSSCSSGPFAIELPLQASATETTTEKFWVTLPRGTYRIDYILDKGEGNKVQNDSGGLVCTVTSRERGVIFTQSLVPAEIDSSRSPLLNNSFDVEEAEILQIELTVPACPDPAAVNGKIRLSSLRR